MARFLILGGGGRLGNALVDHLDNLNGGGVGRFGWSALSSKYADVRRPDVLARRVKGYRHELPAVVINCAGVLSPVSEREPDRAMDVNFLGACNVAKACRDTGVRLVHISTDCVFDGDDTPDDGYNEESYRFPKTCYGRTKNLGEIGVQAILPSALILRVPFRYRGPWPYPSAFTDAYQSSRWIDEVVPDIITAALIPDLSGVLHMGGPRRSIYDMAREASPDVKPCLLEDFKDFKVPRDRTLDSSKWERIKKERGL